METALVTYAHFFSIFLLLLCLSFEIFSLKEDLTAKEARKIARADMIYGIASLLIVATGALKLFYFGKGSAYYLNNTLLWSKLGLFTIVGGLSIYPTIYFIKWRATLKQNKAIQIPSKKLAQLQKLIVIELVIVFLIPLLANFMARGFGYYG